MKQKNFKRALITLALTMITFFAMTIISCAETAITDLKQTLVEDDRVRLDWKDETRAFGYKVYISKDKTNWERCGDLGEEYDTTQYYQVINNLSPGSLYYVYIVPVYRSLTDGNTLPYIFTDGEKSDVITVVTTPKAPSALKQTKATAKSVTLTWKASTGADEYEIYKNNKKVASTKKTTITIKATAGSNDYYKVYAVIKKEGLEETGGFSGIEAKTLPNKPINIAKLSIDNLDWNPQTNLCRVYFDKNSKDSYDPDGYRAEIYTVDGKKKLKTVIAKGGSKSYVQFKLKDVKNKGLQIRVQGFVKLGKKKCYGAWSAKQVVIPQANLKVKQTGKNSVQLKWTKVSGAKKYHIYAYKNGSGLIPISSAFKKIKTVDANKTSFVVSGLQGGTESYFYVLPEVKVGKKTYKGNDCYYMSLQMHKY